MASAPPRCEAMIRGAILAFAERSVRRTQMLPLVGYSVGATLLVLLCAHWWLDSLTPVPGVLLRSYERSALMLADMLGLLALLAAGCVAIPAMVAAQVANERRAGTLDQLRTTPLSPLALVVGLVCGVPARAYLLCTGPLVLHVLCGALGLLPMTAMLSSLTVIVVGTLTCTLFGVFAALTWKGEGGGTMVGLGVAALLGMSGMVFMVLTSSRLPEWLFLHPVGAFNAALIAQDTLWRSWMVASWITDWVELPSVARAFMLAPLLHVMLACSVGTVLLRSICRKLARPHLPMLSKAQALVLFAIVSLALIAPARSTFAAVLMGALLLLPLMTVLGLLASPTVELWTVALRQRRVVRPWHDEAGPHALIWSMIVLAWMLIGAAHVTGRAWGIPRASMPFLAAVAWGTYVALLLPVFLHFGVVRLSTAAARGGYASAVMGFAVLQVVAIATVGSQSTVTVPSGPEGLVVHAAATLGLLIPALVVWRQRVFTERVGCVARTA